MNIDSLHAFTDGLRTEVTQLRHRGLSEMADVLESVANDHEQTLDSWFTEELTLRQAEQEVRDGEEAREEQLHRLVAEGALLPDQLAQPAAPYGGPPSSEAKNGCCTLKTNADPLRNTRYASANARSMRST